MNIEEESQRLSKELGLQDINVHSRKEVPVKWTTFEDPWGNRIGLFEYLNKEEEKMRIKDIIGTKNKRGL